MVVIMENSEGSGSAVAKPAPLATDRAYSMDKLMENMFPWLGILGGPLASGFIAYQKETEPWMLPSLHRLNLLAMVQAIYLLIQSPSIRWGIFCVTSLIVAAWCMAWAWKNIEPAPENPMFMHVTVATSLLASLMTFMMAWSYSHQNVPRLSLMIFGAIVLTGGILYMAFELPSSLGWDPTDVLAIVNLSIGLYVISSFLMGYRTTRDSTEFWIPLLRSMYMTMRWTVPPVYLASAGIFMGLLFLALFISLGVSLYFKHYQYGKENRRMRIATGTFGVLAILVLYVFISFISDIGWDTLKETRNSMSSFLEMLNRDVQNDIDPISSQKAIYVEKKLSSD